MVALIALGIASASDPATAAAPDTSPTSGKPANVNPKTTAIIDYAEPFDGHKPNHNKGGGPGGGDGGGDTVDHSAGHYELIGGVWGTSDPNLTFEIDLRGFPAGSEAAIVAGFEAWDVAAGGGLFDGATIGPVDVAFGDGINTYSMRNLGGRVLAATFITWNDANDNGSIDTGETFMEMDVVHNSTVSWAIAENGGRGKWFDVQNVATHEIGHVYGLAHPGDTHPEDKVQTMFASASPKETEKRDLHPEGDIPGINDPFLGY